MNTWIFQSNQRWSKHDLRSLRLIVLRQSDFGSIWHDEVIGILGLVNHASWVGVNLTLRNAHCSLVFRKLIFRYSSKLIVELFVVRVNKAMLLFDTANNLVFSCCTEGIPRSLQELYQVISDISSSKINSSCCICNRETFTDSTCMGHPITNIQNYSSGKSSCI